MELVSYNPAGSRGRLMATATWDLPVFASRRDSVMVTSGSLLVVGELHRQPTEKEKRPLGTGRVWHHFSAACAKHSATAPRAQCSDLADTSAAGPIRHAAQNLEED